MTAKFKFDLMDKVFVKPFNKNGTIHSKRWSSDQNGSIDVNYEVIFEQDYWDHDYGSILQYLGKKPVFVRVQEEDLQMIESYSDKERKSWMTMVNDNIREINTGTGKTLDKIGELYGIDRKSSECEHVMVPYEGLMEKYNYCQKCDKKEK